MTEASDRSTKTERPRFWSLRPVAFFAALLIAPVCVGLIGAATAPVFVGFFFLFSLPFGAPSYLLVFAPIAWWGILKGRDSVSQFAAAGFLANLAAAPMTLLGTVLLDGGDDALEIVGLVHGFGAVFSLIWATLFGLAYRLLRRTGRATPAVAA